MSELCSGLRGVVAMSSFLQQNCNRFQLDQGAGILHALIVKGMAACLRGRLPYNSL